MAQHRGGSVIRAVLVVLDVSIALSAIAGGVALATGVEGDRFPLEVLRDTPFGSYVLPGLILAVCVGGSATVAVAAALRKPPFFALTSVFAGIVLMGWITGEVLILPPVMRSSVEAAFFVLGLLITAFALLVWAQEHRQPRPATPLL